MNIVKRELKANSKSFIVWSISMAFLVAVWMIKYESIANNPFIDDFMKAIPEKLLSGMGMANLNIATLQGFVGTISLYLYLLLGIHGVVLGSSIISKEERDKTAEYLFSLPVSRERVIYSKIGAGILNLIFLNLITGLTIFLTTINFNKDQSFYKFIVLMFMAIFLIQLVFFSIGMLISSIMKRYKKSGNISVTILMITFIIASLINMVESLDFLKFLTPFKYFDSTYILNQLKLESTYVLLSLLIIIGGIGGTLLFYPKRDLNI